MLHNLGLHKLRLGLLCSLGNRLGVLVVPARRIPVHLVHNYRPYVSPHWMASSKITGMGMEEGERRGGRRERERRERERREEGGGKEGIVSYLWCSDQEWKKTLWLRRDGEGLQTFKGEIGGENSGGKSFIISKPMASWCTPPPMASSFSRIASARFTPPLPPTYPSIHPSTHPLHHSSILRG